MVPPSQPEDVKRLRYRWSRLIEVWVAYRVFLHREVHVGPDMVCLNEAIVAQTGHTLLILYYSYIYSLFDPRGVDFATVTKAIDPMLLPETLEVRDKILELWQRFRDPVERIRHNIGFHGAPGEKGHRQGFRKLEEFHPILPEALCAYLRVFFRQLEAVYSGTKPLTPMTRPRIDALLEYARKLEAEAAQPLASIPDAGLLKYGLTRESYASLIKLIQGQANGAVEPVN